MDFTTTTWLSFVLAILIIQALSIFLGFWMGRKSAGRPLSDQPKKFNPGPPGLEHDPYSEALAPDIIGKRIATII
jgi:hypothetical protein